MEDRKELVVGGYRFDRLSDASEAALEIEKATYFEQRISGRSPENMLAIYDKVLDACQRSQSAATASTIKIG